MNMRLRATIRGNLDKIMRQEMKTARRAVKVGVKEATNGLKQELRGQITGAGFSEKLAKTWRGEVYPKKPSLNAAGFVWSKAPHIISAYARGAVIRSKKSRYLAIPLPAAGKLARRKKMTPVLWEQKHNKKLVYVKRKGRNNPILVAENMRARKGKRGGFGNASQTAMRKGKEVTTVPVFVLVPQVSIKKRFNVDASFKKWGSRVPYLVMDNWEETQEK